MAGSSSSVIPPCSGCGPGFAPALCSVCDPTDPASICYVLAQDFVCNGTWYTCECLTPSGSGDASAHTWCCPAQAASGSSGSSSGVAVALLGLGAIAAAAIGVYAHDKGRGRASINRSVHPVTRRPAD